MIVADELEYDRRLLPRLIEHAESVGDWARANELRERLGLPLKETKDEGDEAFYSTPESVGEPVKSEAVDAPADFIPSLPFADRIKRRLQDYGIFEVNDLAPWSYRLLSSMPGLRSIDVKAIRNRLASMGCASVVGSAPALLEYLPAKNPMAVDVRHGNLPEDVMEIARQVADAEITDREASRLLGSPEQEAAYGRPHQRWGSSFNRNSEVFAPLWETAMKRDYGRAEWFAGVGIVRIPQARLRIFGLSVATRWSEAETVDALDRIAKLNPDKYRGTAMVSWRGISLVFEDRR